jgi:hypothetical protein
LLLLLLLLLLLVLHLLLLCQSLHHNRLWVAGSGVADDAVDTARINGRCTTQRCQGGRRLGRGCCL